MLAAQSGGCSDRLKAAPVVNASAVPFPWISTAGRPANDIAEVTRDPFGGRSDASRRVFPSNTRSNCSPIRAEGHSRNCQTL